MRRRSKDVTGAVLTVTRFYNINNGYVEGIVRGYRNTLLTGQNYGNLTQCETIDGASLSQTTS